MSNEKSRAKAEQFIQETILADAPAVAASTVGSGVNSIVVKAGSAITAALIQEQEHAISARDISNPDGISAADMDRNLAPLLIPRSSGGFAVGLVDIHFNTRRARSFTEGDRATTDSKDKIFKIQSNLSFSESDHFLNPEDGTFFVQVPFIAAVEGEDGNVDVGEINTLLDNRHGAVYIRNPSIFSGGLASQTNSEYLRAASFGVSTRNPSQLDGALHVISSLFPGRVLDALVVGHGDAEMLRDELYRQEDGSLDLGPVGTATGIHVGGRVDLYHWYGTPNFVTVTIDLTIDLVLQSAHAEDDEELVAVFAAGTSSENEIPSTGTLSIDLGGTSEETVRYTARSINPTTGVVTFTLLTPLTSAHDADIAVKVGGNGIISVGVGGHVDILPILAVQSIRLLDPLTLAPVGEPLVEVAPASRTPGWYFSDINPLTLMSAKESRKIILDEKRDVAGNTGISGSDGVTSGTRLLQMPGQVLTGYQGRDITIETTSGSVTRAIVRVVDEDQVELADGAEAIPNESDVVYSIADGFGDFAGFPVRASFYTHTEIQEAQVTLSGGRKRDLAGNCLSRAFLPVLLDFTLRYRGAGSESEVRSEIAKLIQKSQSNAFGSGVDGGSFDISDIVRAAYGENDSLATSVEIPFQVRVTSIQTDGTKLVRYASPSTETVNQFVLAESADAGATVLVAQRAPRTPSSTIPDAGWLFLGLLLEAEDKVEYVRATVNDEDGSITFVLKEGVSIADDHAAGEPLNVSVLDYDPDLVIADGVISADRLHRPYLGVVVVENIG